MKQCLANILLNNFDGILTHQGEIKKDPAMLAEPFLLK